MADSLNFKMRGVYNFDVYPAAKLGTNFKNVTVTGILTESTARRSINTVEMHAYVYPDCPAGTPNDPTAYDYLELKMANGNTTVIGIAWIKPDTVELIDSGSATVKFSNFVPTEAALLRSVLTQAGFKNFTIEVNGGVVS